MEKVWLIESLVYMKSRNCFSFETFLKLALELFQNYFRRSCRKVEILYQVISTTIHFVSINIKYV